MRHSCGLSHLLIIAVAVRNIPCSKVSAKHVRGYNATLFEYDPEGIEQHPDEANFPSEVVPNDPNGARYDPGAIGYNPDVSGFNPDALSFEPEINLLPAKNIRAMASAPAVDPRIVGGTTAPINTYPWFAKPLLSSGGWAGCGGSLVTPEYVLTAAHCLNPSSPTTKYRIGAYCNQSDNCGQSAQVVNVAKVYKHPNYDSGTEDNDFALFKLTSRATATPVPMDQGTVSPNYPDGYRNLYTLGFGTLTSGGSTSNILNHVEIAYVSQATCNAAYGNTILPSMMCAADPGQDSCQGDSGGPLYDATKKVLVGVVSWGIGCADPKFPGVYSRIANQWSWIKNTVCADHSSPKPSFCPQTPVAPPVAPPTTNSGYITPTYGGTGGSSFAHYCSDGTSMVNLGGRGGWWIDQLVGTCADGKALGPAGGSGGGPVTTMNCPQGFTGGSVTYGTYVGKVSLTCGTTTGYSTIGSGLSSGSGSTATFACPSGMTISGFGGKAAGYVDSIFFKCTAKTFSTPIYGGTGGGSFTLNCAAGARLVNLSGRGGSWVDQLIGKCADGKALGPAGGSGGGPVSTMDCPKGFTGGSVTYGTYVGKVSLKCGTTTGYSTIGSGSGSGSGSTATFACPSGMTITGFGGKAAGYVDSVYFKCSVA